jgi:hypothetical protein
VCRTYGARRDGRSESKEVGGIRVHGGVAARVSDVPTEGGDLEEKGGIGLGVIIKFLMVGENGA